MLVKIFNWNCSRTKTSKIAKVDNRKILKIFYIGY